MGPSLPASPRFWSPESPGLTCLEVEVSAPHAPRGLPALGPTLTEDASLSLLETRGQRK